MAKRNKKNNDGGSFALFELLFSLVATVILIPLYIIIGLVVFLLKCVTHSSGNNITKKDIANMTGYEYEEYVASKLKERGYRGVDVTPKSGDFGADILAYDKKGRHVCFQCKKYEHPVGVKAVQEVVGAMAYYNCVVGVVVSTSGYTSAAKDLAKKCKVELWTGV